jgi:hypothetical protein
MSKRPVLLGQGWGFMPVYVGRQADSSCLIRQRAPTKPDQAASLARCVAPRTIIFLDIETAQPFH